jgi:hypothetical protein
MNHDFKPSQLNVTVCIVCKRNMLMHLGNAECESCGKPDTTDKGKSALELINNLLLCRDCFSKELESGNDAVPSDKQSIPEPIQKLEDNHFNKPSDVITSIANSVLADLPQNGNEFFNAEVIAHVELEKRIMNDANIAPDQKHYFFAQQLQARQQQLTKALLGIRELWLETKNRSAAVHQDLNVLAGRLRKEEKEKLKIADVSYVPQVPPRKVGVPRMSKEDKVIESIAKLMFAPKVNGIVQWEALEASEREKYKNEARKVFKGTVKDVKDLNESGASNDTKSTS